jgi:AraC-like DNA-binding protein
MNRVQVLLQTPSAGVAAFDHPPDEAHVDPAEEVASVDAIAFVEAGKFAIRPHAARDAWAFAPGMLFVTPRGFPFVCRHDTECPDDRCLSVVFTPAAVDDLRTAGLPALRGAAVRASARQRFLRHRLRACAPGDALRVELLAGALYESLFDPAVGGNGSAAPRAAPGDVPSDVVRRVARAADLADAEYARPLALSELAAAAGMSPYHFARTFARLAGLPPHRYLTAVRLRAAAHRLARGASVTDSCYAAGFASLSHFVTTFRRRFGVTPAAFARAPHRPAIRAALSDPVWRRRPAD